MKKQMMIMAALFVTIGYANAQHDHGGHEKKEGSKMDHSMHGDMSSNDGQVITYDVSTDFKKQLTDVYELSLKLTEDFVDGEVTTISTSSSQVEGALTKVDMGLLKSSEAHMDWMMNLKEMNIALTKISKSGDLKEQQSAYASFNQALYKSLKAFGTTASTVYYQHCPMALGNKGGFWLSDSEEIKNPYFGDSMPTCGSTKETIN